MARILGNEPIGNIVKLGFDGGLREFIVIHHGKPSADYGNGFDGGTILLMKDIFSKTAWNRWNLYMNSEIHQYLNSSLYEMFASDIKHEIRTVVLPHQTSAKPNGVKTGAEGLSAHLFLLSGREANCALDFGSDREFSFSDDGDPLQYFTNGGSRIAYFNNAVDYWWIRSSLTTYIGNYTGSAGRPYYINKFGNVGMSGGTVDNHGIRPALVLPDFLYVTDNNQITTNQSPVKPAFITVPELIKGGATATVSWGAATDPDGNLAGYRLERSVNGGGFTQIFEGNALSFTDNITYGWNTVAYRVRAYDTAGAVSDYTTGPTRTIFNNSAPTAPPSITVPDEIKGGKQFAISWGAATDVDGNLSGYQLERSLNGGGFEQIYLGADRSVNDTVAKGTGTAAYRVRAYDAENAWSGYTTSATRTVINNTPPVINGMDGDLGLKNEPFSVPYMVLDADGDTIAITERLDGKVLRTFEAGAGHDYSVTFEADAFLQILNGTHTLEVTARDTQGAEAVRSWTWSKNITSMSITKRMPIEVAQMPETCLVNVNGAIPAGAALTVEVCNNGFDDTPSWEDCSQAVAGREAYKFSNSSKTVDKWGFNFRVRVARDNAQGPCHISCVSGNIGGDQEAFILVLDGGNASGRA